MHFERLDIDGAVQVHLQRHDDARGFFARTFCEREFDTAGLPTRFVQSSLSYNRLAGTLRGLHFQWPPSCEGKLVRCLRGRMLDVAVDLRPWSPSYLQTLAVELDATRRNAVYLPDGLAHGFQTLLDDTEILYQMTDFHAPELGGGYRFDDPGFALDWPLPAAIASPRDRALPPFDRRAHEAELDRRRAA